MAFSWRGLGAVVFSMVIPLTLIFSNVFFIYCSCLRIPYLIYWVWILIDNLVLKTPWRGGRPAAWFRRLGLWSAYRNWYPQKLVCEQPLDSNRPHLLVCHPHGILGLAIWSNLATGAAAKEMAAAGLGDYRIVTVLINFWMPFWREWVLASGFMDAHKSSFKYMLSRNRNIFVVVGGASESLRARPGRSEITLMRRKGFVREAIQAGAALVPVFSFGENDLFDQADNPPGSLAHSFQTFTKKLLGFTIPLLLNPLPYPRPVTMVVGTPIPVPHSNTPSQEEIDRVHVQYVTELKALHERHKEKYPLWGGKISELQIID